MFLNFPWILVTDTTDSSLYRMYSGLIVLNLSNEQVSIVHDFSCVSQFL